VFKIDRWMRSRAQKLSCSTVPAVLARSLVHRPRHAVGAAVGVAGDGVEERLGHVEIGLGAADAAVPNGGLVAGAVLALDGDGLAAEGVLVGVAVGSVLVEESHADGDHVVRLAGGLTASTHAGGEVGHLAGVGLAGGRVGRIAARRARTVRGGRGAGRSSLGGGRWSFVDGRRGHVGGRRCLVGGRRCLVGGRRGHVARDRRNVGGRRGFVAGNRSDVARLRGDGSLGGGWFRSTGGLLGLSSGSGLRRRGSGRLDVGGRCLVRRGRDVDLRSAGAGSGLGLNSGLRAGRVLVAVLVVLRLGSNGDVGGINPDGGGDRNSLDGRLDFSDVDKVAFVVVQRDSIAEHEERADGGNDSLGVHVDGKDEVCVLMVRFVLRFVL
jgi:hypothetical protein